MNRIEDKISQALMIVGGYAFLPNEENVSVIAVNTPYHATLMRPNGEVLETNMEDIELDIIADFWQNNRHFCSDEMATAFVQPTARTGRL